MSRDVPVLKWDGTAGSAWEIARAVNHANDSLMYSEAPFVIVNTVGVGDSERVTDFTFYEDGLPYDVEANDVFTIVDGKWCVA